MADLLAIVSLDRRRPLPAAEIEGLRGAHEALRGGGTRHSAATEWAAVEVCDQVDPAAVGIERGDGWLAWAGSLATSPVATSTLAELEGQFALVTLDETGTLTVATDPLGLKPLFVAERGGLVYFSTSALALARHLRLAPSRPGVEVFLRVGNQLGRVTPWEGLQRMQPAEAIRFGAEGGRESSSYWQPSLDEEIAGLDFGDCVEICVERSVAALQLRYEAEGAWFDLTGGFDSRLLALLSAAGGTAFTANTSGNPEDVDVRIARMVASRGGWPWERIGLPADWPERQIELIEQSLGWGDGHLDAVSLTEVLAGHRRKSARDTRLFNGGGGEHFRDFGWAHELFLVPASRPVGIDRLVSWRILNNADLSPLREDPTESVRSTLRAELRHRLEPFGGLPNAFQNDVLHAFRATDHFGPYQAAAGASMHMELPFYTRAITTCSFSAAPRHRALHRLMRAMIARLDPAVAAVETDTGGPAEPIHPGNVHRFAVYPTRRFHKFAARVNRRFSRRAPAEPPSPALLARSHLISALRGQGRLDPATMRSAALYERERLVAVLDAAEHAPAAVDWNVLGRIVTLELSLRVADAGL